MKGIALCVAALGVVLASAAPSWAHDHWHGYYYGPAYHHYYRGPAYGVYPSVVVTAPAVVAPAPVYGYAGYAPYPAVAPVYPPYPAVAPVYPPAVPGPYYYGPSVGFGVRARGVSVGVGL